MHSSGKSLLLTPILVAKSGGKIVLYIEGSRQTKIKVGCLQCWLLFLTHPPNGDLVVADNSGADMIHQVTPAGGTNVVAVKQAL